MAQTYVKEEPRQKGICAASVNLDQKRNIRAEVCVVHNRGCYCVSRREIPLKEQTPFRVFPAIFVLVSMQRWTVWLLVLVESAELVFHPLFFATFWACMAVAKRSPRTRLRAGACSKVVDVGALLCRVALREKVALTANELVSG